MKIYKSKTQQSISICLPSGQSKHISFDGMSDGTALYFCDNKNEQYGIEHHVDYGKSITLYDDDETENGGGTLNAPGIKTGSEGGTGDAKPKSADGACENGGVGDTAKDGRGQDDAVAKGNTTNDVRGDGVNAGEKIVNVMKFANLDDAKDFLADEYGISRTSMRGEKAIMKAAENVGIKIELEI